MKFVNIDRIIKTKTISYDIIKKILSTLQFQDTTMNYELAMCKDIGDVVLEDITTYDDIINSPDSDHKSNILIVKNTKSNKNEIICFKSQTDRKQIRTIKQKLADASTAYLTEQFDDKTFSLFFESFYVPLSVFIKTYAENNNLIIPNDIVLTYKGGNLFKILLNDISKLMESSEYRNLLRRSDADFQLFINPSLKNYDKIVNDLSILVSYNLLLFKKTIKTKGLFNFFKIDKKKLLQEYIDIFESNGIIVKSIELVKNVNKKDCSIDPTYYNDEKVILYREHKTLLQNAPNISVNKDFYISRNTALDFNRKDNQRSIFNLIRMKKNIKIRVNGKNISVPSEIIDVSIPCREDSGTLAIKDKINKYMRLYKFKNKDTEFMFYAPNINYMIKDLDDMLFKQADFPWSDLKIDKRVIRYFISLLFHQIMTSITQKNDIIIDLNKFKKELKSMVIYIDCYIKKNNCDDIDQYSRILSVKYEKLSDKINKIKNVQERTKELLNFNKFNEKLKIIINELIKNITILIANYGKLTNKKIELIYKNLIKDQTTNILGGTKIDLII